MRFLIDHKVLVTLVVAALVVLQLLWEQQQGGIATHHLMARGDMPGVSNLWGLLTLPALTWITLTLVQRRLQRNGADAEAVARAGYGLLGAFVFGALLAVLWEFRQEHILQYLILLPLPLALFIPVSRPEQLLGFVLAMSHTFGGVLPILFGLVLMTLGFLIHYGVRGGILWLAALLRG
jgi:hypothetical protein